MVRGAAGLLAWSSRWPCARFGASNAGVGRLPPSHRGVPDRRTCSPRRPARSVSATPPGARRSRLADRAAAGVGGRGHRTGRDHRRAAASVGARHPIRVCGGACRDAGGDRSAAPVARVVRPAGQGRQGRRAAAARRRRTLAPAWFASSARTATSIRTASTSKPGSSRTTCAPPATCARTGAMHALDAFAGRPSDFVERARERVRARILAALPDARYAGVIVALTIGDQRAIPESQWRVFNRTGITHLISISGLARHRVRRAGRRARPRTRAPQRVADDPRLPARKARGARRRRRGDCLRAARRCAGPRAAHAADARRRRAGPVAGAAGNGGDRLAVGAGGGRRLGSVGGHHARILAVVRQRRAADVRACRPAALSPPAGHGAARSVARCASRRARSCWSPSDWCR